MATDPSPIGAPLTTGMHETLAAFQAGDHGAFAELVRKYQSLAFALAMRFMWDHDEAEDIVQESFIKVWRNCSRYRVEVSFSTWLYAIVTRVCMDRIRQRKRWGAFLVRRADVDYEAELAATDDPLGDLHTAEAIAMMRRMTSRLPRVQRLVFTLRDLHDLPVEDVERITGMSAPTIKANLYHARKRVRDLLRRRGITEGR